MIAPMAVFLPCVCLFPTVRAGDGVANLSHCSYVHLLSYSGRNTLDLETRVRRIHHNICRLVLSVRVRRNHSFVRTPQIVPQSTCLFAGDSKLRDKAINGLGWVFGAHSESLSRSNALALSCACLAALALAVPPMNGAKFIGGELCFRQTPANSTSSRNCSTGIDIVSSLGVGSRRSARLYSVSHVAHSTAVELFRASLHEWPHGSSLIATPYL